MDAIEDSALRCVDAVARAWTRANKIGERREECEPHGWMMRGPIGRQAGDARDGCGWGRRTKDRRMGRRREGGEEALRALEGGNSGHTWMKGQLF